MGSITADNMFACVDAGWDSVFAGAGAGSCTGKGETEMGTGIAGWCGVVCSGAA